LIFRSLVYPPRKFRNLPNRIVAIVSPAAPK